MITSESNTPATLILRISSELQIQEKALSSTFVWLSEKLGSIEDSETQYPEMHSARNQLIACARLYSKSLTDFEECLAETVDNTDSAFDTVGLRTCLSRIREIINFIVHLNEPSR